MLLLVCVLTLLSCLNQEPPAAAVANPHYPFPQHAVYAPGTIRPNHRTQAQQDDDARAYYDDWKANYLFNAGTTSEGNPLYRVAFGATAPDSDRTVSEGQGYGMIIVALMAGYDSQAQVIFDGLWEFARAHPSEIDNRLMDWDVPDDATGNDSAFDGDADIAYALLLADKQWGSNGRINYQSAAETTITAILESTIGPTSRLPLFGDWVDPNDVTYNQYTPRSSDFMPAHFRAYGRATSNPVWSDVIASTQTVITSLQTNHSPITGLLPDFIVPISPIDHTPQPAPPDFLEGPDDGHYAYNAGRDPWRIATDALLNNDPVSRAQANKITGWVANATGGNPDNIKAGYQLDGTPTAGSNYFTIFFAAPFGVGAMTAPSQQTWLNTVYDAVYDTHEGYYEDSVTLLCLLIMTGNYWDPTAVQENLSEALFLPLAVQ
jgi:endo-1,4-beta-D-glucanase Y